MIFYNFYNNKKCKSNIGVYKKSVLSHSRSSNLLVYAERFDRKGLNAMLATKGMRSQSTDSGVHLLVRGLSVELPASGGNGEGTRRVCRLFLDQSLGNPVSTLA